MFNVMGGQIFKDSERWVDPTTAAEGIERSILKWETMRDALCDNHLDYIVDGGDQTCGLCKLFLNRTRRESQHCQGCPIFLKTGLKYCKGTPYEEYSVLGDDDEPESSNELSLKLVEAEIEFLKGLQA